MNALPAMATAEFPTIPVLSVSWGTLVWEATTVSLTIEVTGTEEEAVERRVAIIWLLPTVPVSLTEITWVSVLPMVAVSVTAWVAVVAVGVTVVLAAVEAVAVETTTVAWLVGVLSVATPEVSITLLLTTAVSVFVLTSCAKAAERNKSPTKRIAMFLKPCMFLQ